jgi:mRNA-degrading endonuclease YafQ of YafQ-DinJ toxin-antitoxin module
MNINIISTNKFDKEFKLSLRRGKKKENLDKVINLLLDNINRTCLV